MKLFKQLLVAPAAIGFLAPLSVSASEINLDAISKYSEDNLEIDGNSFQKESSNKFSVSNIFNFFINNTASRAFSPFTIFCIS